MSYAIATFHGPGTELFFSHFFEFSAIHSITRLWSGTENARLIWIGSGGDALKSAVGEAEVDRFRKSIRGMKDMDACVAWLADAYEKVRFEFDGPVRALDLCHCRRCRKATGSAFLPSLQVPQDRFRFVAGEEAVRSVALPVKERPPAYTHAFCSACGSPVPFVHAATGQVAVPAGSLDDDPEAEALRHIYVEHEASWYGRAGAAPRFTSRQIRELRRSTEESGGAP